MASTFTQEQLRLFLDYIDFPACYRDLPPSPEVLTALHIHVISKLPYENLGLHYNPEHYINLDPQYLFQKVVLNNRGRGGFCMEGAILYNHILRVMGFDAYTAGARTRPRTEGVPRGNYPGWAHIVNIITFPDGARYHSDVAFGGDGPTLPMPLTEGFVHANLGTQEIRLAREWLPDQVRRVEGSKQWIYQYRNSAAAGWNSFYAFGEGEFLLPDWGVVNHWVCTHEDSNQVQRLLIVSFLRRQREGGAEHEQEIYGKRMLVNGVVKENLGGRTVTVKECGSEEERVGVIKDFFGITLLKEERKAMLGRPLSLG